MSSLLRLKMDPQKSDPDLPDFRCESLADTVDSTVRSDVLDALRR